MPVCFKNTARSVDADADTEMQSFETTANTGQSLDNVLKDAGHSSISSSGRWSERCRCSSVVERGTRNAEVPSSILGSGFGVRDDGLRRPMVDIPLLAVFDFRMCG